MRISCNVCELIPAIFTVTFGDKTKFCMCEECTNDLCVVAESFFLDMTIQIVEPTFESDPAEFLPFSSEVTESHDLPILSPDWPINW